MADNNSQSQNKQEEVPSADAQNSPPAIMEETNNNNKQKEVATEDVEPPAGGATSDRPSQVQQILNRAAPYVQPFSFTSLLTSAMAESASDERNLEEMISLHEEKLREEAAAAAAAAPPQEAGSSSSPRTAEERAAKRLKEKEEELSEVMAKKAELESQAEEMMAEAGRLAARMRYIEQELLYLRGEAQPAAEAEALAWREADAMMRWLRTDCWICNQGRVATVVLLPCYHVAVCTDCEPAAKSCPVCGAAKVRGVEINRGSSSQRPHQ
ncbi:uncharacterized protein LOC127259495 [Andrographis paniculata]|uniref:uncharacterized protein LOC127259495 n=1 Tax=Andrographis paniculata TaxID=175694 RepID=UPI0021E83B90|nr:uncharacterized protein LOC127259495 [Andrographis paniculata]